MASSTHTVGWRSLSALMAKNASFRRLFFATLISFAGDWFAFVAISGFVTEHTTGAGGAALVYAAHVLPTFFFSPLAGVIADRMSRKHLMVWADVLRVPVALGLCVALWLGSPLLAIVCIALISAGSAFFEPVAIAALPNVVDEEDLAVGQAAFSSLWGSMLFFGAALGGVVSGLLGRQTTLVINAASFAASAWLVAGVTRPLQEGRLGNGSFWAQLGDVWTLAKTQMTTLSLMTTKLGVGLANGLVGLLPTFAIQRFGAGDEGVGLLLGARGLGSLVGAFFGQKLVRGTGQRLFFVCGLAILVFGTFYVLLPSAPSLAWAATFAALAHVGGGAQWSLSTYGLQRTTPDILRGRVLTLDFGLATLAMGVSSLGASAGAETLGLERTSVLISSVALVYGLGFLVWTRRFWRAPTDPLLDR